MTFHVCFENDAKLHLSLSKHQENEFTKILHFQTEPQKNLQKFYINRVNYSFPKTCKKNPFHLYPSVNNLPSPSSCFKFESLCNTFFVDSLVSMMWIPCYFLSISSFYNSLKTSVQGCRRCHLVG